MAGKNLQPTYWQTSGLAGPPRYDRNGLPEAYNLAGHHIYQQLGEALSVDPVTTSYQPNYVTVQQNQINPQMEEVYAEDTLLETSPNTTSGISGNDLMGGLSIGLAIGQAIGGIYSAISSSNTSKYVSEKQAQIAEDNRQRAQMSAESAYRQGEAQVAKLTYEAGQTKAKQRNAMGANGVLIGRGSSAEVLASTDTLKTVDKLNAEFSAMASAWGYKQQAAQQAANAQSYRTMGSYASSSSYALAGTSLLNGGLEAASRWYKYFGS